MLMFGLGTLPAMLFISVAFGKMKANVRGLMYKLAAFIMIAMGINTVYMGLMSYNPQMFMHHNFIHNIVYELNATIELLKQTLDYFKSMIHDVEH